MAYTAIFIMATLADFSSLHWNAERGSVATIHLQLELLPPALQTATSNTFRQKKARNSHGNSGKQILMVQQVRRINWKVKSGNEKSRWWQHCAQSIRNKCFSVYSGMLKNFKGHEKIMRGVKLSKNIQCCLSLHITIPLLNKSNLVGWSL